MADAKRVSLVKPTLQTRYHIDFDWWKQSDRDWRVYLRTFLCLEHQEAFAGLSDEVQVDWVDAETAEVTRVDGLQHTLVSHCARLPGFIPEHSALVDAVFRLFLANGNVPLTPVELAEKLGRQPDTVLRTISGLRVYKGLRPFIH